MKIKFLGSGGAWVTYDENFHSNILISNNDKNLLFDCGGTINDALKFHNLDVVDIDGIYTSHLHFDHIGGLETVSFKTYFNPNKDKIELYGNSEILESLWDHSLQGGLRSLQGTRANLETYFNTNYIEPNGSFEFEDIKFDLLQTLHVVDDRRQVPSYGLLFETDKRNKVFITGDTQFTNQMISFYESSDYIFHDVEFSEYDGSVHAQYRELITLPVLIKRKMYLYHYSLNGKTYEEMNEMVLSDGFGGLVKRGEEFDV